ncbi:MAG: hypothetical protein FJW38_14425 [Acidobacteria bacterium]|nr:hypothetical protein [Acidobacteriota bacterium]
MLGDDEAVDGSVTRGLWPGTRDTPRKEGDADIASASREPWVDANGYLAAFERALGGTALLAQQHKDESRGVPFDTLELALIEARVNGGNFVLSVEPRYRKALVANDAKALEAWANLVRTLKWLRANEALFTKPAQPIITTLVERSIASSEIANLLYRRGASPLLTAKVPAPNPRILALVATGLKAVPPAAFDHARAGATVVIDTTPPSEARVIKTDPDRRVLALGKGQIFAYNKRIADPSEFALDVIDIVTHRRRAARLWNAPATIPLATEGGLLHLINYSGEPTKEMQVRYQGKFTRAMSIGPDGPPQELKVFKRAEMTEVFPPPVRRLAVIQFR